MGPSWESFKEKYDEYIKKAPCELGRLMAEDFYEAIHKLSDNRAVAACGFRTKELKELPLVIVEMMSEVFNEVEEGGEWPSILLEVLASSLRKEASFDADEVDEKLFLLPEASKTRIINNFSPLVAAWESARWGQTARWREKYLPDTMHGGREGHEPCDVTLDHAAEMELAVLMNKCCASVAIDWRQFFDRIERRVGKGLIAYTMEVEGTTDTARGFVEAENRLMEQARYRFKVGKSVEKESTTRSNGYYQGSNWSIQQAPALMSVWTRAAEAGGGTRTAGFIDDSSMQSVGDDPGEVVETLGMDGLRGVRPGHWDTGCKLNAAKTKALASNGRTEEEIEERFQDIGLECSKAIVLVGGNLSNGRETSRQARDKLAARRYDKMKEVLERIDKAPEFFEFRDALISRNASPVGYYGSELHIPSASVTQNLGGRVHRIVTAGRARWRARAATLTLPAHGHLVDPFQAQRYWALLTGRRALQRRPDIRRKWRLAVYLHQQEGGGEAGAHGAVAVLLRIAEEIEWTIDEDLVITRRRGGKMSLVDGDDRLFAHLVGQDLRREVWRIGFYTAGENSHFREGFDGIQAAGIDYDATMSKYRRRSRGGRSKGGEVSGTRLSDQQGIHSSHHRYVMGAAGRGACRMLWSGALMVGERLHKAGLREVSSRCPYCLEEVETYEHALWECRVFEEIRAKVKGKYSVEELESLPGP